MQNCINPDKIVRGNLVCWVRGTRLVSWPTKSYRRALRQLSSRGFAYYVAHCVACCVALLLHHSLNLSRTTLQTFLSTTRFVRVMNAAVCSTNNTIAVCNYDGSFLFESRSSLRKERNRSALNISCARVLLLRFFHSKQKVLNFKEYLFQGFRRGEGGLHGVGALLIQKDRNKNHWSWHSLKFKVKGLLCSTKA